MAEDAARTEHQPRLGRGLAALLGAVNEEHAEFARGGRQAPIEFLRPNPRNPRKRFDDGELDELAASIKEDFLALKGYLLKESSKPLDFLISQALAGRPGRSEGSLQLFDRVDGRLGLPL